MKDKPITDEQLARAEALNKSEYARLCRLWSCMKAFGGNNINIMIEGMPQYKDEFVAMQKRIFEMMDEVGDECERLHQEFKDS